jgi:hypothetical protein
MNWKQWESRYPFCTIIPFALALARQCKPTLIFSKLPLDAQMVCGWPPPLATPLGPPHMGEERGGMENTWKWNIRESHLHG